MPTETSTVTLSINGQIHRVPADCSVAVALLTSGVTSFRTSVTGQPRAPLCGMGICYECRVTINGQQHQKSCQITVADGMKVVTGE